MLLVHPLREVARALPVLAGVLLAGSSTGRGGLWGFAGTCIVIVLGILRWFTTTYRIAAEQVQVRRGLLRRQVVSVSLDRVRTVDLSASALHRVLGLVRVTVGTGLSDRRRDDALRLDGLTAAEAARLRNELLHRRPSAAVPTGAAALEVEELARLRPLWVAYGPFTLSGVLTVFAILGFTWRVVSEARVDPLRLGRAAAGYAEPLAVPRWTAFLAVPVVLLVVVGCASVIAYVLTFWGFRLVRMAGGSLHVTRGLISTRAITIEERRLRGVEVSEPLLLRAVGGARCIAIATGLRVGRGAERGGTLLFPPGPARQARRVAAAVLRSADPVTAPLVRHGPRAHRRRFTRMLTLCALPVAVVLVLWRLGVLPAWTWEAPLALIPLCALLAHDRYRGLGHALAGRFLVSSRGSLVRRRYMLARDGIIGWNLEQSFFQRRAGLATLVATTAAGLQRYSVQDVRLEEAVKLADEAVPDLLTPFLEPRAPDR
jgi:putative membrane protein